MSLPLAIMQAEEVFWDALRRYMSLDEDLVKRAVVVEATAEGEFLIRAQVRQCLYSPPEQFPPDGPFVFYGYKIYRVRSLPNSAKWRVRCLLDPED